ncbi:translation initiation factor IF-2 isoform X1 [Alligator mississippiensis]|uniref:translation initiation factor IF-2 isoform X1 n=1 Tax=Alligator mississippiensis TaxID=8496 RepID=UPI0028779AEB|nr:translation initiation factor IF-2 isoform X1 [Alligator mississippiensis]
MGCLGTAPPPTKGLQAPPCLPHPPSRGDLRSFPSLRSRQVSVIAASSGRSRPPDVSPVLRRAARAAHAGRMRPGEGAETPAEHSVPPVSSDPGPRPAGVRQLCRPGPALGPYTPPPPLGAIPGFFVVFLVPSRFLCTVEINRHFVQRLEPESYWGGRGGGGPRALLSPAGSPPRTWCRGGALLPGSDATPTPKAGRTLEGGQDLPGSDGPPGRPLPVPVAIYFRRRRSALLRHFRRRDSIGTHHAAACVCARRRPRHAPRPPPRARPRAPRRLLRRPGPGPGPAQRPGQGDPGITAPESAIGLGTFFLSFLVPAGWILAHLESYKKRD